MVKSIKKTGSVNNKNREVPGKLKAEKKKIWAGLRTYQKVLIILFSSLLFIGGCGAGYFFYYINSVNKTMNQNVTAEIKSTLSPVETKPQAPSTILLLGIDTRDAENDKGRADTIMLLHINPLEKIAYLLSIPRDTLVDIPGHGKDKINAAYAYGGEELMIKTVSSFLDAQINHYATIDFEGFVKLIDALGGVDINIERPIEDPKSGAYFSAGNHHFTGEQALSFTRSRATEFGDIGRIQRQQLVFKELIKQKLNVRYLSDINNYFNIIVENTRTDLDIMTILSYSRAALSFGIENINSAIIPTHPEWIENGTKSVQVPDQEEAKAMWQRVIFGQPVSKYGLEYINGVENIPDSMGQNKTYLAKLKIKNTGQLNWHRGGENPFYMSYHWLDFETKKVVVFDGERTLLPVDTVYSGQEIELDMKIKSPQKQGSYILQVDMVHEGQTWFSYQGVPPLEKYLSVNLEYAATYNDKGTTPKEVAPGEQFIAYVTVTNNGFMTWENDTRDRVNLGVHWYNRDTREVIIFDGDSGELPNYVGRGESALVKMIITAPEKPGRYIIAFDLVHENVTWFSHQGVIPLEADINVGIILDKSIVKKTSVMIYNGAGVKGAAAQFQEYLEKYGFKISGIKNAKSYNFDETIVIYNSGKYVNAEQLALILNSYRMEQYTSKWKDYYSSANVIVIMGKDYKENIKW
ncbi:MAG: hypothetical protein FJW69_00425 [Actinobacteria bacterium]|nr:hypothetical protein [Actinomycetota bacterium]